MKSFRPHKTKIRADERIDQFMEGRLKLIQSKDGYRFSIDAILLSQFVTVRPGDVVVDLGTGCGVILLILLLTKQVGHAFGLEIQKELVSQAARNSLLNGFEDKMNIILGDIRRPPMARESADVIICNPPYRKVKSGRINPDPRRAIARHEILASVDDILRATTSILRKKGRLALIYPSVRLVDILARLRKYNLEPKRIQINYPGLESGAKLALIEATLGGKPGLEICPPLIGQGNKFGVTHSHSL
ncbi:MAG: methyltransferase domain-containing protein [Deltaproteobacteria bacterium]|nr:methyltransferase domain-containing protein [Deltaproteobacteria bacterium]MBW1909899.1 methyltransferase domain-containing protein [Deltaproteobacteria bacterium]MBW2034667.1 methyltransferase domain-containing protein [Deltaproteobacteria bacterium]MBW2115073.1 methyltransferase domain-containing protein [Deltaproteobacteria bacterium]